MVQDPPTLEALLERLDALEVENAQLRQENAQLRQRVQTLEAQLAQDSSNSHRPPSSDDPWPTRNDDDDEETVFSFDTPRKQGAQAGHPGHHRQLVDSEHVDQIVECVPEACTACGHELEGQDPTPWRHQVYEAEVTTHLTEYRMHRLQCPGCCHSQRAELPEGVGLSPFGDSVCAWASWMTGRFDLSKRACQDFLVRGLQVPISLGSVCALERRATRALGPAHTQALEALQRSEVVWVDETGWFEKHQRAWLWSAVGDDASGVTVYRLDPCRSRDALEQLVAPDFDGIVTSDRYSAYNGREPESRQICWQHLMRDFRGLCIRDGPGAGPAHQLLVIAQLLFSVRARIDQGKLPEGHLERRVEQAWRQAVRQILEGAAASDEMPGIFKNLLKREQALWTFAYQEGVEPTNHRAERAIRPGVLKRKRSFGTQSAQGSRFIERMLTVTETLRRQGRSVLDFLTESLRASRSGHAPPRLVPACPP